MRPAAALNAAKPAGATPFPAHARVASSMRRSALPVVKQRRFRLFHAKTGLSTAAIASRSNAPLAVHVAAATAAAAAVAIAAAVVAAAAAGATATAAAETGVTATAEATGATAGNRRRTDEISGMLLRSSKTTRSQSDEDVTDTSSPLFVLQRGHSRQERPEGVSVTPTLSSRLPGQQPQICRSRRSGPVALTEIGHNTALLTRPPAIRSTICDEHALVACTRPHQGNTQEKTSLHTTHLAVLLALVPCVVNVPAMSRAPRLSVSGGFCAPIPATVPPLFSTGSPWTVRNWRC